MSRRLIAAVVALAAAGVVLVLGLGAGSDQSSGGYKVRAIFDNAFTVIAGEDVKIAGVKVGKIDALDVTPDNKAAVVLDITEPGFQDFRKDGTCTIRPQSLIGERFVECTPTQPKAVGQAPSPKLDKINSGPGKGQYLLPSSQTIKPIDIDLIGNIMRLPYRERFTIILNELGTGLAANGDELRSAIRSADPALRETDKVLAILAQQNQTLADLASNGDRALAPLAREKARVADFIVKANTTAQASAERRTDIERNLQKFPAFLRQFKPTLQQLGALSDQMTPVLTDLGAAAPSINRFIKQLGPFSQAGIPALTSLGDAADVGDQALLKAKPLATDLQSFASQAKPTVQNLDKLLTSVQQTGGIERLMDFLYYQGTATNGYDTLGHYLRAVFVATPCTTYVTAPTANCHSFFNSSATASAAQLTRQSTPTVADVNREIAAGRSPYLARQDAVAHGLDPAAFDQQDAKGAKSKDGGSSKSSSGPKINLPAALLPGSSSGNGGGSSSPAASTAPAATAPAGGQSDAGTGSQASSAAPSSGGGDSSPTTTLLDYLLGG